MGFVTRRSDRRNQCPEMAFLGSQWKASVWVEIATVAGHKPFLKTVPDGTPLDNPLNLPQCPK